ncbi:MAG: GNAT family N-acetyltransferase [Gammaproteobacteria bacterium]
MADGGAAVSIRNLEKIFKPRRVVLIGIDNRPEDIGKLVLSNLLGSGFRGIVYPVSFSVESVSGVPTYPDLASLPKTPDLAVICTQAADVPAVVEDCGAAGIMGLVILSSGFSEADEEGRRLEERVADAARRFEHMRIIGPNSLGIIVPEIGLNASQAVTAARPGHLAFISQSHSLSNAVLDWAADSGIGFSLFASLGNNLDVGYGDLIDYLGTDTQTRAIILYVQSIRHARRFMSAARSFACSKPIVAYKSGRFERSAHAALSHTGTIAGHDAVYSAVFERAGVVRVMELDDIFDVAEILASQRLPAGSRLAIIGNAGGPAIIAADALLSRHGQLAELGEETVARLDEILPEGWSHGNPVDLLDAAPAERYAAALDILHKDPGIDAILVILATHPAIDSRTVAAVVVQAAETSRKPLFAAWMGGARARKDIRYMNHAGVPAHATSEQAIRAFMHLVSYAHNLQSLYDTPREMPIHFSGNRNKLSRRFHALLQERGSLTENEAKLLLKAYDIPVCDTFIAHNAEEAVAAAEQIGYPVVLKLRSPEILHKIDIGGVALDLQDASAVQEAYETMLQRVQVRRLAGHVEGVTLQRMICPKDGLEMILGASMDPTFGPVIMVGLGGVATEIYSDHALGLPPLNERLARNMVESLRCWPMLQGYRGSPPVNIDRLIEAMIRFSCLIADYPEIREFDINPLLATPDGVVALDAAAVLDREAWQDSIEPYEHLAIRPYPEQFIRRPHLRDGTQVTLRPIRPEDEPLWHELIAKSSPESIRFRFRSLFRQTNHAMAVKHCMIDYERELAMVVETESDGQRQLIGVGQLITDLNHETAEYAVLVPDPWQGKGVGGLLLDYCLELAARWGISEVVAETDPENMRMLSLFHKRGFNSVVRREEEVVFLRKQLV